MNVAPACDHKFVDSKACLKCGWEPSAAHVPSAASLHPSAFLAGWAHVADEAYENARAKGWWDDPCNDGEKVALMHSELSEALEGFRKPGPSDKIPEFSSVEEEYADVVIRIMDHARHLGLDVAGAIVAKMKFNATRPHRHGGKRF